MKIKIRNRLHRYDINRPKPRYNKIKSVSIWCCLCVYDATL